MRAAGPQGLLRWDGAMVGWGEHAPWGLAPHRRDPPRTPTTPRDPPKSGLGVRAGVWGGGAEPGQQ